MVDRQDDARLYRLAVAGKHVNRGRAAKAEAEAEAKRRAAERPAGTQTVRVGKGRRG